MGCCKGWTHLYGSLKLIRTLLACPAASVATRATTDGALQCLWQAVLAGNRVLQLFFCLGISRQHLHVDKEGTHARPYPQVLLWFKTLAAGAAPATAGAVCCWKHLTVTLRDLGARIQATCEGETSVQRPRPVDADCVPCQCQRPRGSSHQANSMNSGPHMRCWYGSLAATCFAELRRGVRCRRQCRRPLRCQYDAFACTLCFRTYWCCLGTPNGRNPAMNGVCHESGENQPKAFSLSVIECPATPGCERSAGGVQRHAWCWGGTQAGIMAVCSAWLPQLTGTPQGSNTSLSTAQSSDFCPLVLRRGRSIPGHQQAVTTARTVHQDDLPAGGRLCCCGANNPPQEQVYVRCGSQGGGHIGCSITRMQLGLALTGPALLAGRTSQSPACAVTPSAELNGAPRQGRLSRVCLVPCDTLPLSSSQR